MNSNTAPFTVNIVANLHIDAFEEEKNGIWKQLMRHNPVDYLMACKTVVTYWTRSETVDQTLMKDASLWTLSKLHDQMVIYDEECKKSPTHVLWRTYIKMIVSLLGFVASHNAENWERSLAESSNMLPVIVAAGHHSYMYALPLFLNEMNNVKSIAQYVYQYFTKGH